MYLKETKKRGKFIMTAETLVISFEGEKNVDFEILSDTLDSTVETLRILADYLINENEYRKFNVTGIQNGNVIISISQILEYACPTLPTVLQAFKQLIEIRIFLKGLPPKNIYCQGNNVEIINNQGIMKVVNNVIFNIYSNEIEKGMASVVKKALDDNERKGLSYTFIDNIKEECLYIDEKLFSHLSVAQDVEKFNKGIKVKEIITYVNVRIPDLVGNTKWICTWNDKDIACEICDIAFLKRVHHNEISFTSSSKIHVRVLIRYKNTEILSYKIIEVFNIINERL